MKKFSKKLFCLMLVAIMVATAIPFGAFADHTHSWTTTDTTHMCTAVDCTEYATAEDHRWNEAGVCTVCGRTHEHSYGATPSSPGDAEGHVFTCTVPNCPNTKKVAHTSGESFTTVEAVAPTCTTAGRTAYKQYSCGYAEPSTAIDALGHDYVNGVCSRCSTACSHPSYKDGKCTVCDKEHTHTDWAPVDNSGKDSPAGHKEKCGGCDLIRIVPHTGERFEETAKVPATCTAAGTEAKKTYACGYVTGGEKVDALGHIDENCDGVCDRTGCGAAMDVAKVTYKVCVKLSSTSATLAEGKSVEYTEAQVKALDGASAVRSFLNGLGGDYAKVAGDMTDNNFDKVTRELGSVDSYLYVWLKSVGSESEDTSGKIQVVYDDGTVTYIPKKVGTWYFSTSNLGLDDTWGTTQAKLKIYDANGSRNVKWDSEDNDAFVKATDYKVEVLGINRTVTIYFMKSSTANPTTTDAYATKYYEANTRLGVLPSVPDGYTGWYVGQEELTVDTVYHWKEKFVYAYPGKGVGSGRVHLFIYNKNNELMKNVDVTENVQDNGLISKTGLLKTVEYQTGRKNPDMVMFDESGWAYYLNNKNSTAKAKTSVDVGRAADRQGTQNIYIVLTNVSGGSNADTSNPKTGDTAMIGTAAIVMALAAVGMGTAFYMKKKELF